MRVGIIGLGLIGGSLGLVLRDMKLISKVIGLDKNEENQKEALRLGLVDEIASFEVMKKACDMIFLAIPVEAIKSVLKDLEGVRAETTIVEFGSTKRAILSSAPPALKSQFIAAHPMAGTENSGPKAAFKTLLNGAVVVICDDHSANESHMKKAVEILSHAGMKIVFMDASAHDYHTGIISHLPHAISFSLVNAVLKEEDKKTLFLLTSTNGSFSGMARIAKSSPEMWVDIFRQNQDNILKAIKSFKDELNICEDMLENSKWDELQSWMQNARQIREIM